MEPNEPPLKGTNETPANETERKVASGKNNQPETPITEPDNTSGLTEDEKKIIGNESTAVPKDESTPIDNPVITREHNRQPFAGDTTTPIPEPTYQRQFVDPNRTNIGDVKTNKTINQEKKIETHDARTYAQKNLFEHTPEQGPANPAFAAMSTKEQKEQVEMTVDTVLHFYAEGKKWVGETFFTTSEANLIKMEQAGEIPLGWPVLYDKATRESLTILQFVLQANSEVMKACETTEKWKETIRPALVAEFMKRGWALSSQQNIGIMVLLDLLTMFQKMILIKMNSSAVLNTCKEQFEEMKKNGFINNEVYNPYISQPQAPQPQQQYQEPQQQQQVTTQNTPQPPVNGTAQADIPTVSAEMVIQEKLPGEDD